MLKYFLYKISFVHLSCKTIMMNQYYIQVAAKTGSGYRFSNHIDISDEMAQKLISNNTKSPPKFKYILGVFVKLNRGRNYNSIFGLIRVLFESDNIQEINEYYEKKLFNMS